MPRKETDWIDALNSIGARTKTILQDCINSVVEEEMARKDITAQELLQTMRIKDAIMRKYRESVPSVSRAE